jgi:NRAMP (natural resistance-associated macrophage protein)-like metal ion transporter
VSFLKRWRTSFFLFFAVLGPGFITAAVDNDSGGILTYSQAGAQYGYHLVWTMLPITIALIVVQEMCARMGVVTGKGLSDLIREEFGLRMTFFIMLLLVVVNFGNVIAEFSGVAGAIELFHISKYISVPISALAVWLLVVKGDYKSVEKIFLAASGFYVCYIIAGFLAQPVWHDALIATVKVPSGKVWSDRDYVYMTVGVIGTTITPWMQFYLQSSVVEKGISIKQYAASRMDVIVGSIFSDAVAWFIIVACAATL